MDQDVELTKAALLYADDVEIVSLGVSMFDELRQVVDARDLGGYGLLASLDDETVSYLANRGEEAGRTLPANWREILGTALSLDPDQVTALGLDGPSNCASSIAWRSIRTAWRSCGVA